MLLFYFIWWELIVGKFGNEFIRYSRMSYIWLLHNTNLSAIYHYFKYKPMGLYSRGLIFEWFFCQQIIGLIFEGAYNRGGLYSRFYGIFDNKIFMHFSLMKFITDLKYKISLLKMRMSFWAALNIHKVFYKKHL